jgi:hypothetical protein
MARFAHFASLLCLLVAPLHAQEALPQTPPELRDFRIEPERAEPQPESGPEIRPSVTPPAVEPAAPERTADTPTNRPAPTAPVTQTRRAADANVPDRPAPSSVPTRSTSIPPMDDSVVATPNAEPEPAITAPPTPLDEPIAPSSFVDKNWQAIASALLILLGLLLASWFLLRRKRNRFAVIEESLPSIDIPDAREAPTPVAAAEPKVESGEIRPHISIEFRPERATLSFTALTVKGTLVIENFGKDAASDMHMRATMISANRDQAATIAAFFNGTIPVEDNVLGVAQAGEKIALELEISIPSQELQSYSVAERQIIVPVIVADLSYRWSGGQDSSRLACLVGREAQPPQRKMGPLRLDLGPRSFSSLGQRPLYA